MTIELNQKEKENQKKRSKSRCIVGTIGKILNDYDLMEFVSYFLDLRCMRY